MKETIEGTGWEVLKGYFWKQGKEVVQFSWPEKSEGKPDSSMLRFLLREAAFFDPNWTRRSASSVPELVESFKTSLGRSLREVHLAERYVFPR